MSSISDKTLPQPQAQAPSISILQMTDVISLVSNKETDPLPSSMDSEEEERSVSPMFSEPTPKGRSKALPPLPLLDKVQDENSSFAPSSAFIDIEREIVSSPLDGSIDTFDLDAIKPESPAESIMTGNGTETPWSTYLSSSRSESESDMKRYSPDLIFQSPIFSVSSPILLLKQQAQQQQQEQYHQRQEQQQQDDNEDFEHYSPQTSNSFASSVTDHSARLSDSTMASSIPRLFDSEIELTDADEIGIALGNPREDNLITGCSKESASIDQVRESEEDACLNHVKVYNVAEVGLGLRPNETSSIEGEIGLITPPVKFLPLEASPLEASPLEAVVLSEIAPLESTPQESPIKETSPLRILPRETSPLRLSPRDPLPLQTSPVESAPQVSTPPPVPPRAASRRGSRIRSGSIESSSGSSKQSGGSPVCLKRASKKASSSLSRDVSVDESVEEARMNPYALSIYTESIRSARRDSMISLSPVSPRTSSLKKAKSRNRLRSKDSITLLRMTPPRLDESAESRSARHGHQSSISSLDIGTESVPESRDEESMDPKLSSVPQTTSVSKGTEVMSRTNASNPTLLDYLTYAAAGLTNDEPAEENLNSPIVFGESTTDSSEGDSPEEEFQGVEAIVIANGKRLTAIQSRVGPETTHLLLSGSDDEKIVDFLEGVLPLVGKSLLVLDLSNTRINEIPGCISHCTNLQELNISSTSLQPTFYKDSSWAAKLNNIHTFTADHCGFPLVPASIMEMKNLTKLSLQHNKLTHLPSWLYRLDRLDTLLLAGNPFKGQWEKICRSLIMSVEMPLISKQEMIDCNNASDNSNSESSPTSPTLKDDTMKKSSPTVKQEKSKPVRPFMRKMKSHGSELNAFANGFSMTSIRNVEESNESSARRPSLVNNNTIAIGENGEKKWGNMIRKMGRKSSTTTLAASFAAGADCDNASIRSRSNSFKGSLRRRPKIEVPAMPLAFQSSTNLSPTTSKPDFVRSRFIAQHADEVNRGDQGSKLRGLMQYLQDLDDLGCDATPIPLATSPPLATPGSELSMELSMASQSSSSSSCSPSKGMSRSESENSRKSSASDTSISSNECPSLAPGLKDDSQKRIHIIQELLATEESYIRTLQELVKIYVTPSAALDPITGHCLISLAERKKVFANVDGILQFHQGALYPALRMVAEPLFEKRDSIDEEYLNTLSAEVGEKVAGVMLKHAAFFRMYTAYVNGVNDAVGRVAIWRSAQRTIAELEQVDMPPLSSKDRKRIKTFLIKARSDKRHSQLSLETYLHLPVQRIPRYRLLLEDLVRNCPQSRLSDPTIITKALDSICSVATLMNESKRQNEKNRKLLEWQNRVKEEFPSPLVQPHRQLLKDGTLVLQRIVTRSSAFHLSPEDPFGGPKESLVDGESKNGIIQVDCLDQQSIKKKVTVLLCNDITVLLTDDSPYPGPTSPVNLFAAIRIKESVQLKGQTTLRIVDAKHILYFTASTPAEAQEWQEALSKVHQQV